MAALHRWVVAAAALIIGWAGTAQAAYTLIEWDWSQGSGVAIEGFKVKCGRTSGSYTVTTTITDTTARSYDLYTVTNGKGQWYCTVVAYTGSTESSAASEASFVLPVPPFLLSPVP